MCRAEETVSVQMASEIQKYGHFLYADFLNKNEHGQTTFWNSIIMTLGRLILSHNSFFVEDLHGCCV